MSFSSLYCAYCTEGRKEGGDTSWPCMHNDIYFNATFTILFFIFLFACLCCHRRAARDACTSFFAHRLLLYRFCTIEFLAALSHTAHLYLSALSLRTLYQHNGRHHFYVAFVLSLRWFAIHTARMTFFSSFFFRALFCVYIINHLLRRHGVLCWEGASSGCMLFTRAPPLKQEERRSSSFIFGLFMLHCVVSLAVTALLRARFARRRIVTARTRLPQHLAYAPHVFGG